MAAVSVSISQFPAEPGIWGLDWLRIRQIPDIGTVSRASKESNLFVSSQRVMGPGTPFFFEIFVGMETV